MSETVLFYDFNSPPDANGRYAAFDPDGARLRAGDLVVLDAGGDDVACPGRVVSVQRSKVTGKRYLLVEPTGHFYHPSERNGGAS